MAYAKGDQYLRKPGSGGALYRCMRCKRRWEGDPGPVVCPQCAHVYVKWVNYEEWREEHPLPPLEPVRDVAQPGKGT